MPIVNTKTFIFEIWIFCHFWNENNTSSVILITSQLTALMQMSNVVSRLHYHDRSAHVLCHTVHLVQELNSIEEQAWDSTSEKMPKLLKSKMAIKSSCHRHEAICWIGKPQYFQTITLHQNSCRYLSCVLGWNLAWKDSNPLSPTQWAVKSTVEHACCGDPGQWASPFATVAKFLKLEI